MSSVHLSQEAAQPLQGNGGDSVAEWRRLNRGSPPWQIGIVLLPQSYYVLPFHLPFYLLFLPNSNLFHLIIAIGLDKEARVSNCILRERHRSQVLPDHAILREGIEEEDMSLF
ncbi:hypothetical protein RIF29_24869 [Crotalaria pallida]|uniref:Uncharacterized protein n=1 Tax=Crotalaria pallida TaxID=3830 RepID=A0AAN9HYT3_CROPI